MPFQASEEEVKAACAGGDGHVAPNEPEEQHDSLAVFSILQTMDHVLSCGACLARKSRLLVVAAIAFMERNHMICQLLFSR